LSIPEKISVFKLDKLEIFIILTVIISKDGTLTRGLSSTGLLRMTTDLGYSTDLGFFGDFLGLM
jgi:hypothetical protein